MSKRARDSERRDTQQSDFGGPSSSGLIPMVTFLAAGVLIFLSAMTWAQTRRIQSSLDERLGQLQSTIAQLSSKVEAGAGRAAQPRQGPDPNRVYTIKTSGAPAEGPETAPITIAEFSEFQ